MRIELPLLEKWRVVEQELDGNSIAV